MTCSKCGKKVRGRPAPSGLCKECRGADSKPQDAEEARETPVGEAIDGGLEVVV